MRVQRIIPNNSNSAYNNQILSDLKNVVSARLPVLEGEFKIHLFKDDDDEGHVALVMGNVKDKENVLVRVHSECLTGDVFGSIRCDCGEQLRQSIQIIIEEGLGILLYLRQEGRGIGLHSKLRAYNLQDEGYDTVDANIALGHDPDERDYNIAALILKELNISSIRLLSNNPLKFEPLIDSGIKISERIPLKPRITSENVSYLKTKISRMNHILDIDALSPTTPERESIIRDISRRIKNSQNKNRPFITISYAQSLNGFIAKTKKEPIKLSGKESLILTHQIRSIHDAILVGIGTILADDPQLNTRLVKGRNPRPIILDTHLKFPVKSKLFKNSSSLPWIVIGEKVDKAKFSTLEDRGAKILQISLKDDKIDLSVLLPYLARLGIRSIMVEGGADVISSFVKEKLVDLIISTLTPYFISNGLPILSQNLSNSKNKRMALKNFKYIQIGRDLIAYGTPFWNNPR